MTQGNIQLGVNGVTDNFISTLKNHFNKHQNVKVNVLRSAGRNKENVREVNKKILEKLGKKYTSRVIGFTIFIKKWRRAMR